VWILCWVLIKPNEVIIIFLSLDKFSKMTHFVSCKKSNDATSIDVLIFQLHSFPRGIPLDMDRKFNSHLWRTLWNKLDTKL
jgi:hypothetical protein